MRIVALVLFGISVSGSGVALAQSDSPASTRAENRPRQDASDEVVVRGRRVGELRAEVEAARQRAYRIFNDLNSNDEFDVGCRKESRAGTNVPQQVCRARFEDDISAAAAREYMATISWLCQPRGDEFSGGALFLDTQACMFSGPGQSAKSSAQAVEGRAPLKRDQMAEEILRVARADDRFAQAILDFYEASQQYDAARKRRDD